VAGFADREAVMVPLLGVPAGVVVAGPVTVTVNDASAVLLTASAARHSTVRLPGGRKY
jgi:predicted polyphosphate/ATP-dependent NAD kinase